MRVSGLSELQKELSLLEHKQVLDFCMRLAKHKKENKELLTYLLFESNNETAYVNSIKKLIDDAFVEMNRNTIYLTKKSLRKILRMVNKYIKFSGSKQTELELRIYFCSKIRTKRIPIDKSIVLSNLYHHEVDKIKLTISKLHEDLQYDYQQELDKL